MIIPAYNAARTIDECLEALLDQSIPRSSYEIIVVDDGSTDNTAKIVQKYGSVHLLSQPRGGPAAARNLGARFAKGEILLFTDADCVPVRAWIEEMTRPFADPGIAGVRGAFRTKQRELVARFVQIEYEDRYDRIHGQDEAIDFVDGYAAGYRRTVFDQVGGFDVNILGGEDIELSHRLARQGHKLVFASKAMVYHHHPTSIWRYAHRKWFIAFWRVARYKKHPQFVVKDTHTPQVLKLQSGLGVIFVGTLLGAVFVQQLVTWAVVSGLLLVLSGGSFYFKVARKDLAVGLLAPIMVFVRGVALGLGFTAGIVAQVVGGVRSGEVQLQRPGHWF